jgi:hypothetical protein
MALPFHVVPMKMAGLVLFIAVSEIVFFGNLLTFWTKPSTFACAMRVLG